MNKASLWAIVPAAGIGQRMQSEVPKQYLPLHGATVLEHTLNKLLSVNAVKGLVVALHADDQHWDKVQLDSDKPVVKVQGGEERSSSVLNALHALSEFDAFDEEHDWVLVHDAVRPCVRVADIDALIATVAQNPAGGLLALPVRDTMKRQRTGTAIVQETVEREGLWHALTPQLFAYQALHHALSHAIEKNMSITDEASALEQMGLFPLLVQGHDDNIKITRPDDLRLAELYLQEADK